MSNPLTQQQVFPADTATRSSGTTVRRPSPRIAWSPVATPAVDAALPFRRSAGTASVVALLATDIAALLLAGFGVRAVRALVLGPMPLSSAFVATGFLWIALRAFYGLYPGFGIQGPEELRRSANSTALAALAHSALLFANQDVAASRFIAVGSWLILIPIAWLAREFVKGLLIKAGLFGRPVAILGAGQTATMIVRELRQNPGLGIVPVAMFDDDPLLHGQAREGVPVLGSIDDAKSWRGRYPVRDAIIALSRGGAVRQGHLIHDISRRFARVGVVGDTLGLGTLWTKSQAIGAYQMLQVQNDRFERRSLFLKRTLDLALGIPLFLLALPVIAFAGLLVKYFSHGPAFYSQKREGLNGTTIRVWKIRTMVPDADRKLEELLHGDYSARQQWEERMKLDHDPRIVRRVGRFLRRSSIDELPQLWNVIRGDMSLVGPRPFPNYHLRRFSQEFRELRHQVPPGITGYWQITHRSEASLHDQQATDRYYIHNWSLWLDLWILFRTAGAVLDGKGAR